MKQLLKVCVNDARQLDDSNSQIAQRLLKQLLEQRVESLFWLVEWKENIETKRSYTTKGMEISPGEYIIFSQ